MPKDHNKCKPCEDSTYSSSSKSCHKEETHDSNCDSEEWKPKRNCDYCPEEIVREFKDAVVEIHSEFILLGTTGDDEPISTANGSTPLSPGGRMDVILEGNGFFIKGHYIVAPAQLVLLPPSLTSVVNRFPFISPTDLTLGTIRDQIVRASRILVSVFNVNGDGHSFVYEADLVGVDGAGDIAVLRINYKKQWNLRNPHVEKCHPHFKFGSSRASCDGEKVFLIGDYISNPLNQRLFNAVGAVSEGLLSDHRYLEYSGFVLAETILVSAPAYAYSAGLPIINCNGQVIGMQTTDLAAVLPTIVFPSTLVTVTGIEGTGGVVTSTGTIGPISLNQAAGSGFVAGPSEFFMRRVIKTLINGTCSRKYNCQIDTICDPAGSYYRYNKSYAGIAYDVLTGSHYDTTTDYTSGIFASGLPRIRLTNTGNFLNSPACKELIGIRVLGLAGINPLDANGITNGYWYVPGGTGAAPLGSTLSVSPFLNKLLPGDIITHINGVPIGDLCKQIAPSLITWRLCGGDQLEICYRRGGNALNNNDNSLTENYDNLYTYTACLGSYPPGLDYPWYAVNIFPLLSLEGFVFPVGQLTNPQYPSLSTGTFFHPSI